MREGMRAALEWLPLQFRVLFRQFLLRVVDLEALSIKADVIGFLGQFAGILVMLSLILSMMAGLYPVAAEETLIFFTVLTVGLITVITWDATFPDRRDVLVLAPLPVRPRTLLAAKVTASGAVLGLAVLALNAVPSLVLAMRLSTELLLLTACSIAAAARQGWQDEAREIGGARRAWSVTTGSSTAAAASAGAFASSPEPRRGKLR